MKAINIKWENMEVKEMISAKIEKTKNGNTLKIEGPPAYLIANAIVAIDDLLHSVAKNEVEYYRLKEAVIEGIIKADK